MLLCLGEEMKDFVRDVSGSKKTGGTLFSEVKSLAERLKELMSPGGRGVGQGVWRAMKMEQVLDILDVTSDCLTFSASCYRWKVPAAFTYFSTRMICATATALLLTIVLGPRFIKKLYEWKIGQAIRSVEEVPLWLSCTERRKIRRPWAAS